MVPCSARRQQQHTTPPQPATANKQANPAQRAAHVRVSQLQVGPLRNLGHQASHVATAGGGVCRRAGRQRRRRQRRLGELSGERRRGLLRLHAMPCACHHAQAARQPSFGGSTHAAGSQTLGQRRPNATGGGARRRWRRWRSAVLMRRSVSDDRLGACTTRRECLNRCWRRQECGREWVGAQRRAVTFLRYPDVVVAALKCDKRLGAPPCTLSSPAQHASPISRPHACSPCMHHCCGSPDRR